MTITRLETIIQLKQCPDEITLKILEAAESGVEQWSDEIIQHLIDCQSCRLMLEDFIKLSGDQILDEHSEVANIDDLIIVFTADGIYNSQSQKSVVNKNLFRGRNAPPKSENKKGTNSFIITTQSGSVTAEIFWIDDHATITLSNVNLDDEYYLIKHGDNQRIDRIFNDGNFVFDNINPGNYIIKCKNQKTFFKIIQITNK